MTVADAFGQMLRDGRGPEIIERDDGFLDTAKIAYFAPVARWPAVERRALRWARGRVLDASPSNTPTRPSWVTRDLGIPFPDTSMLNGPFRAASRTRSCPR